MCIQYHGVCGAGMQGKKKTWLVIIGISHQYQAIFKIN